MSASEWNIGEMLNSIPYCYVAEVLDILMDCFEKLLVGLDVSVRSGRLIRKVLMFLVSSGELLHFGKLLMVLLEKLSFSDPCSLFLRRTLQRQFRLFQFSPELGKRLLTLEEKTKLFLGIREAKSENVLVSYLSFHN